MGSVRSIRAAVSNEAVDAWIVSEIDSWTAQDFVYMVRAYGTEKPYVLNIYSPGGDPFAAFAIHDFIKANGIKATARVWGHAASAAAIIACSCARVEIGENSFMMIHNAYGDVDTALLDSINEKQVALFRTKSGMSASAVTKLMKEETWMDAKAAKANGMADSIIKELAIAALFKAKYMEEEVKPVVETPEVKSADHGDEQPTTELVEVEIPVTPAEGVAAAWSGKLKAKVSVNAELRTAMTSAIQEAKETKAQLREANDEVTALKEKVAKAELDVTASNEAKAKAEGELAAMNTQLGTITAEVDKLKKAPLATAEGEPKGGGTTPGAGPTAGRTLTRDEIKAQQREDEMKEAFGRLSKNKPA